MMNWSIEGPFTHRTHGWPAPWSPSLGPSGWTQPPSSLMSLSSVNTIALAIASLTVSWAWIQFQTLVLPPAPGTQLWGLWRCPCSWSTPFIASKHRPPTLFTLPMQPCGWLVLPRKDQSKGQCSPAKADIQVAPLPHLSPWRRPLLGLPTWYPPCFFSVKRSKGQILRLFLTKVRNRSLSETSSFWKPDSDRV